MLMEYELLLNPCSTTSALSPHGCRVTVARHKPGLKDPSSPILYLFINIYLALIYIVFLACCKPRVERIVHRHVNPSRLPLLQVLAIAILLLI